MNKKRLIYFLYISFIASIQLGVIIPFFSMIAYSQQISSTWSGLVAAMSPLGGLVVTFFSEKIVQKWGFQRTMMIGLCGNLLLFFFLWLQPISLVSWFIARFFMGMMFSLTFMPAQTAIGIEAIHRRAFYVNLIGVVFVIGLTIGPLFTNLIIYGERTVLLILMVMQLSSLFMVWGIANKKPPQSTHVHISISRMKLLSKIGVAFLPALLFGCVELSLLSLFPQEALAKQFTIAQISWIVAVFSFAALCIQLPVSLLADKFHPRRVAVGLYTLVIGTLALPLFSFSFVSLLITSIGLGLWIGHGYYFSVAFINAMVPQEQLVKANILLETVYNLNTIVIPIVFGFYLQTGQQASIFKPLLVVAILIGFLHVIYGLKQNRKAWNGG